MTENKKRFRKEHIKGTGMQFIVDETTRKENSTGSVGYKAYSTTDMTCDKLVDLLNELHEENQELRMDNDIKFWKHQFMSQYNENQVILHELSLAINKGYEISDKFKKWIDDSAERNKEVMEKNERLFE